VGNGIGGDEGKKRSQRNIDEQLPIMEKKRGCIGQYLNRLGLEEKGETNLYGKKSSGVGGRGLCYYLRFQKIKSWSK